MADSQKLVLMVQSTRLQGLIWQAVLKSQRLSVIWETSDINLIDNITQLNEAGLALPDLLVLDMRLKELNAYEFCRWCRDNHPSVKVVLTDSTQKEISSYEHRWALYQGAAELLPGFQQENLVSSVAAAVKRVLEVMDSHPLDNGSLISILLSMKRQLDSRAKTSDNPHLNGKAPVTTIPTSSDFAVAKRAQVNDTKVSGNGKVLHQELNGKAALDPETPQPPTETKPSTEEDSPPVKRRYRGMTY